MPIHFSIGFVVTEKDDRQYITVCGAAYDDLNVRSVIDTFCNANAVANNVQEVVAVWTRRGAKCR